jgi:hypothetical protein
LLNLIQLFLRDLLKCVDPNNDSAKEFQQLRDCLQKVEETNRGENVPKQCFFSHTFSSAINKRLANYVNRRRMMSLSSQFGSDPKLLAKAERLLEREGWVKVKEKQKWVQRKLFLFNDLFVVASKPGSGKLKLLDQFVLDDVRCSQQGEDEFVVRIKSKNNMEMVFKCEEGMQQQLEWIHAITNGVALMLSKKK